MRLLDWSATQLCTNVIASQIDLSSRRRLVAGFPGDNTCCRPNELHARLCGCATSRICACQVLFLPLQTAQRLSNHDKACTAFARLHVVHALPVLSDNMCFHAVTIVLLFVIRLWQGLSSWKGGPTAALVFSELQPVGKTLPASPAVPPTPDNAGYRYAACNCCQLGSLHDLQHASGPM